MKIFLAGGTGAIGRPLITELLARGHDLGALTRSPEKAQALVEQGVEPAIADVFDADAVKAVIRHARPEVVIEQLTALPRTYTRESMGAAAVLNTRLRLDGGANVLVAAQAAGVRRYLRQSIAFWAVPGPGLADEETPLALHASPAVAFKFSGFVAWWLWRTIYLMKLPGFERKLRVAIDWTLDLFFPRDIVYLRPLHTSRRPGAVSHELEASEEIHAVK
jgi:hypothetical protein